MLIITKVLQIILADISTEPISRQKSVFFHLLLHRVILDATVCLWGLKQGQGKCIEAFTKDWPWISTPKFSTLWIRLSWLVWRCWRAVINTAEENPSYTWTETARFPGAGTTCRGPEYNALHCSRWDCVSEGNSEPPHFLSERLNVFLLCAASSTAEVWFTTALPVPVSVISDIDTFHLDFYRELLSHCPLERVQSNF